MKIILLFVVFSIITITAYGQTSCCQDEQMSCYQCPMMSHENNPCLKSNMNSCLMCCTVKAKSTCCSNDPVIQSVPDTCQMFGNMKSHSGMMRVMGPFYCLDSINFSVHSTRAIPYDCMMGDTVWMQVCCFFQDGKMHRTTIYYGTDQGLASFDVVIQAPGTSRVERNDAPAITMELHPNPAMNRTIVSLSEIPTSPMIIEIADQKGNVLLTYALAQISEISIVTQNLPIGIYHLLLRSNNGTLVEAKNLVVIR